MIEIDRTLIKIVSNLWFEWSYDAHILFRSISPYMWGLSRRNLYRFLEVQAGNTSLYHRRLAELLTDPVFFNLFKKVETEFKEYMQGAETIVSKKYPEMADRTVAYFSMEYGIDIIPMYSGGLGILSGDHLRGASDVGLKMVGVGLFYMQGHYEQQVSTDGSMRIIYDSLVPPHKLIRDFIPLEAVKDVRSNKELVVEVPLADRVVRVRVWRARVGKTDLLLLDTDLHENLVHDRHITRRLYDSQKLHEEERKRRLEQEIVLGIGGAKALQGAGYRPDVYHLNEGHVAFAAVEVLRQIMAEEGVSFEEAKKRCADRVGFTTHTPVPEGNERFDEQLVRAQLGPYLHSFLSEHERDTLFNCARNYEERFDMTKLSLLLSGVYRNGVSKLHGEVCRRMWSYVFDTKSHPDQTPIGSITNAVHVSYWQKPLLRRLIEDEGGLQNVQNIADEKIWLLHLEFKTKLIDKIRDRYAYQLLRDRVDPQTIHQKTRALLDVDSFILGFARRFADYKRATLIMDDEEKLFTFLEQVFRKYGIPVHIVFAGKPHPNHHAGQERIRQIHQTAARLEARAAERNFRAQIVFVENYDIDLARYLEAGVDVWLNNPIRPHEASGTSGMKAGMNGVLNVSIPDGWVPEGVQTGINGWLFGSGEAQEASGDRDELFRLLEQEILPAYFDRETPRGLNAPFSKRWVQMMKNSIQSITRQFNTDRMLCDYIEQMYLPAVRKRHAQKAGAAAG
ncbi:MAG: alpha-glucan family phosphorylase [Candidatus Omnitrophica bacterium]|nr:alpha-glucan family phosphorylase [Candidatus Omnitrophota bacterium]